VAESKESQTLFVRNIGYETDEPKFLEYMKKFGEVKYAVLCKSQVDDGPPHKGTGFVRFKQESSAVQLLELSQQVEGTMDKERKASRLQQTQKDSVISSLSLLKNEIELDGRRLIVKPKVSKEDAHNI